MKHQIQDIQYINPILYGDYCDPTIVRVGEDYYMTHSGLVFSPCLLIWHSRDLVHWTPVGHALDEYLGDVWAPELVWHEGMFYIYFPILGENWVITAPSAEGPWSKPVKLKVQQIDPGHIIDRQTGQRYLHVSDGHVVELAADGLSIAADVRKVFEGWPIPEDWEVEGFCLESPKLFYRKGYYYLTVAQGGTAGPPTGHMAISARSKSPLGPWELSPYNPIVRTQENHDTWWSRGHGTVIDTVDDHWVIVYHAYHRDHLNQGRMTLMEPLEWTADGWFRVTEHLNAHMLMTVQSSVGSASLPSALLPSQTVSSPSLAVEAVSPPDLDLSDPFSDPALKWSWAFYKEHNRKRYQLGEERLILQGKGDTPPASSPLCCMPQHPDYEAQVELTLDGIGTAGMILLYNDQYFLALDYNGVEIALTRHNRRQVHTKDQYLSKGQPIWLKLRVRQNVVSFFWSRDQRHWQKLQTAAEISGYHHNVLGGFLSLRLGLFCQGEATATFRQFDYHVCV